MGMDSKSDRASIADISLPVHAVQATSSYAESPSTSAEWIARAAIILIPSGMAWYTWGIGEIFKSTTDVSFTFLSPFSTENFYIVISATCTVPWRRTNPPYTVMIYEKKDVGQASSQTGGLQPN